MTTSETLDAIKPVLYVGGGVAFLAYGAYFLRGARKAQAAIALLVALFLFLMPKLENVAEIQASATGLTLKLAEATSVLDRLRRLASLTGKSLAEIQLNSGALGGAAARDRDRMEGEIVSNLVSMSADPAEIERVKDLYRTRNLYDYLTAINEHYKFYIHGGKGDPKWDPAFRAAIASFPPSPDTLESFIKQFDGVDDFTSKLLSDYRAFLIAGRHVDQAFWAERDKWPTDFKQENN